MIKKTTIEKLYLLLTTLFIFNFCHTMMLEMNKSEESHGRVVIPTALVLISTGLYSFLNLKKIKGCSRFNLTFILLTVWMLLVNVFILDISSFSYIKLIYITMSSLLPLSVYYYYQLIPTITNNNTYNSRIYVLLLLLISACYFGEFTKTIDVFGLSFTQIGISYFPLLALPLALLHKKMYVRIIMIIIVSIAVLSSMKRGGVISLGVGLAIYFLVEYIFIKGSKNNIKSIILRISLAFTVLTIGFLYFNESTGGHISKRFAQIEDDQGSGRTAVWEETWKMIQNSTEIAMVTGNGMDAVLRDSKLGYSAHNDFLEILYNYGIIGFILYIFFHIQFLKKTIFLIKKRSYYAPSMAMLYIMFIILTMISHVIVYPWYILTVMLLGVVKGSERKIKN